MLTLKLVMHFSACLLAALQTPSLDPPVFMKYLICYAYCIRT